MSLWTLSIANDLCEFPLMERVDGSEPDPCQACIKHARDALGVT